jgi:hypothetical protein
MKRDHPTRRNIQPLSSPLTSGSEELENGIQEAVHRKYGAIYNARQLSCSCFACLSKEGRRTKSFHDRERQAIATSKIGGLDDLRD